MAEDSPGQDLRRCERCGNLRVQVPFEKHTSGLHWLWGWRCLACGDFIDSVIVRQRGPHHRQPDRHTRRLGPRSETDTGLEEQP